jgi:hypothetical protein
VIAAATAGFRSPSWRDYSIDKIVSPGLTVNPAHNGWVSPSLELNARRR